MGKNINRDQLWRELVLTVIAKNLALKEEGARKLIALLLLKLLGYPHRNIVYSKTLNQPYVIIPKFLYGFKRAVDYQFPKSASSTSNFTR